MERNKVPAVFVLAVVVIGLLAWASVRQKEGSSASAGGASRDEVSWLNWSDLIFVLTTCSL